MKLLNTHPLIVISRDARGVSLLELALILPLVVGLIAALVDFGFKFNVIKQIASATRHGARIAASHSRTTHPASCGSLIQGTCPAGAMEVILQTDTIVMAARKASCNQLKSAEVSLEQWNVSSEVGSNYSEAALLNQQMVRVEINRIRENCFICYNRLFEFFETRSHNRFVLEEPCS